MKETSQLLEGDGHRIEPFDLTNFAEIPALFKKIAKQTGRLSGLVHCAGVHLARPLRFLTGEELTKVMRTNVDSAFALAKSFRQKRVCVNGGSIVFLTSVSGLIGQAGETAYAASKGALIALARSLAVELAREGHRVNCIAPALVETKMAADMRDASYTKEQYGAIEAMHLLGVGKPEDVAAAVAFLLADTGRWITGTTLTVDGGYTCH